MTAPAESRGLARERADDPALRRQGALAGVFGALLLAAFFLYLDTVGGRPLFTPTLLATALMRGGEPLAAPGTVDPSLSLTLLFTVLHGLVFVATGVAVAELLVRTRVRHRGVIVLVVLGVLCATFFGVAARLAVVGPGAIAVRDGRARRRGSIPVARGGADRAGPARP